MPAGMLPVRPAVARGLPPGYAILEDRGLLKEKVEAAYDIFSECTLCPRQCGVNRLKGEKGYCRASAELVVSDAQPHFGEEISLVGEKGGSGTIFFSNCNLRCVFCQNWPISHLGLGRKIKDDKLADVMLHLQRIGCHNINLVTPTHVMPNILAATRMAYQKGLRLPLVYNTSGYENLETIKLLDGIVDIYLPDMKYMESKPADEYSGAPDYPEYAKKAILEMHRQVGIHQTSAEGIALRGLMIRHLVMPNRTAGTEKFVQWVAENLPKSTYVNIMPQYHVDYKAFDFPDINRRISVGEYLEAMGWAKQYGLTNLDPTSLIFLDIYRKNAKKQDKADLK